MERTCCDRPICCISIADGLRKSVLEFGGNQVVGAGAAIARHA